MNVRCWLAIGYYEVGTEPLPAERFVDDFWGPLPTASNYTPGQWIGHTLVPGGRERNVYVCADVQLTPSFDAFDVPV